MNVVFIQPPKFNERALQMDPLTPRCNGIPSKAPYLRPPIGLAYIAAYVRETTNANCTIIDAQAEGLSLKETAARAIKADIAIISTSTPTIKRDIALCKAIKESNREVKTALIGTHASYFHKELIKNECVDFIIRGEAEFPVRKLLEADENFGQVPGLTWKKGARVRVNEDSVPIKNLDSLPFAARDLLDYEKYYDILIKGKKLDFVISSRGCPFNCKFCASKAYSKEYRERSAENVIREVREIAELGHDDITFFDDTFTVNRKRVIKICEGIKELNINWRCLSRIDTVDKELLEKMYESGCYQIEFGVESGSQRMLDLMGKGYKLENIKKVFKIANDIGLETVAFFILGYPGETRKSILKTIKLAKELNPDFASFNIFEPRPGSPIFDNFKHRGNWENYNFGQLSFCEIPQTELREYMKKAYVEFYLRPGYVFQRVKKVGVRHTLIQNLKFWFAREGTLWDKIVERIKGGNMRDGSNSHT
ncbi:radical SAM protein [Candidatus Aerophobetes bacterium]|nr:radical SAM protein [Candidatus Aerophobetes bacterium]